MRALLRTRQREAESVTSFDQQLTALGIRRVEPLDGIGHEDRKRDAQWPVAFEDVKSDPDDALPSQLARQHERCLRCIRKRHRPGRRSGRQTLHHLHVVEARVAQQRVGRAPIHDGRRFHSPDALNPIGVHNVNCQYVAGRPDRRRHVVQHDKVERGRWVGQIGRGGQFDVCHGAEGFFQKPVCSRNQQNFYRLGQEAHD